VTIAFWCILVALLAPYLLSVASRSQVSRGEYVDDPRAYSDRLIGWHRRAHLAQLNAFEAVPAITAGVVVAELAHAPRLYIDAFAVAFIAFRAMHAACYLADWPTLRSHAWRFGFLCVIGLFVVAAVHGRAEV
jgi:uncharacterized MAPEG superfamily protein